MDEIFLYYFSINSEYYAYTLHHKKVGILLHGEAYAQNIFIKAYNHYVSKGDVMLSFQRPPCLRNALHSYDDLHGS